MWEFVGKNRYFYKLNAKCKRGTVDDTNKCNDISIDPSNMSIKIDRVWHDNPGRDWLKDEIEYAKSKYVPNTKTKKGHVIVGSVTAGFEGRLPVSMIKNLPGENNEHLNKEILSDFKSIPIKESIKKEGVKEPITIFVNHLGDAYISEGNHRTALAADIGLKDVPVEVRYFAGGELIDGPWKLNKFEAK